MAFDSMSKYHINGREFWKLDNLSAVLVESHSNIGKEISFLRSKIQQLKQEFINHIIGDYNKKESNCAISRLTCFLLLSSLYNKQEEITVALGQVYFAVDVDYATLTSLYELLSKRQKWFFPHLRIVEKVKYLKEVADLNKINVNLSFVNLSGSNDLELYAQDLFSLKEKSEDGIIKYSKYQYYNNWFSKEYFLKENWLKHYFCDISKSRQEGNSFSQKLLEFYGNAEKSRTFPNTLYQFSKASPHAILDILNGEVYLGDNKNFNDVFDSTFACDKETFIKKYILDNSPMDFFSTQEKQTIIKLDIQSIISLFSKCADREKLFLLNKLIELATKDFNETIMPTFECAKISCFTYNKDKKVVINNSAMWAYYADGGKGVCVKYNINKLKNYDALLASDTEESDYYLALASFLYPVHYTNKRPSINFNKIKSKDYAEIMFYRTCLTKSTKWSRENEYRLIVPKDTRFYATKIKFPFVECIYLGAKLDYDLKRSIALACEKLSIEWVNLIPSNIDFTYIESSDRSLLGL